MRGIVEEKMMVEGKRAVSVWRKEGRVGFDEGCRKLRVAVAIRLVHFSLIPKGNGT